MANDPRVLLFAALLSGLAALPATAREDVPQTAIPWLAEDLLPAEVSGRAPLPRPQRVAVAAPVTPDVTVSVVSGPDRDAVGLVPAATAGLPADLWRGGDPNRTLALLRGLPASPLPGIQDLVRRLALAEATPPARPDDALLLARVDALMKRGALEEAQALIERAGPDRPDLFLRWFDIALLLGTEERPCAALAARPALAPQTAARVFCLAREGRWMTAMLTLEGAAALGDVSDADRALLTLFLEPEAEDMLSVPDLPTPLELRLFEAVGAPLDITPLPVAYAWSDLRFVAGWPEQLRAAERLARAGAMPGNRLLGLYTDRPAFGDGPLWDRVRAIQALDVALASGDRRSAAALLVATRETFAEAGLETALAEMTAPRLGLLDLDGDAAEASARLILLDGGTPEVEGLVDAAAAALASGAPVPGGNALAATLHGAFDADLRPITNGTGEAILAALTLLAPGAGTSATDWATALTTLRDAGLDRDARRIAADIVLFGGTGA